MVSFPVLDVCCGGRMMWFDKQNPNVVFGDCRRETITVTDRSNGRQDGTRSIVINPDVLMDFRDIPFEDDTFNLVVFDPPHLVKAGDKSWLASKYGRLSDCWEDDIKKGFEECFRVLKNGGTLIFKWNETQIKTKDVLALTSYKPLFGHRTGHKGFTHWYVFLKASA